MMLMPCRAGNKEARSEVCRTVLPQDESEIGEIVLDFEVAVAIEETFNKKIAIVSESFAVADYQTKDMI